MHQHLAEQPATQMPEVTCPDALDMRAIHELAKDGTDAVAQPPQLRAPGGPGIALAPAIRRQRCQAASLQLVTQGRLPVVAVAYEPARRGGGQLGDHGQFMYVGRRQAELGNHAWPLQAHVHAEAAEGLPHHRVFAIGRLPAEAPAAEGARELADWQREAIHHGDGVVMWELLPQLLPEV